MKGFIGLCLLLDLMIPVFRWNTHKSKPCWKFMLLCGGEGNSPMAGNTAIMFFLPCRLWENDSLERNFCCQFLKVAARRRGLIRSSRAERMSVQTTSAEQRVSTAHPSPRTTAMPSTASLSMSRSFLPFPMQTVC